MTEKFRGLKKDQILNKMHSSYNPLEWDVYFRIPVTQMPTLDFYDMNSPDADKKKFAIFVYKLFENYHRQPQGTEVPASQLKTMLEDRVSGTHLHLLNDSISMEKPFDVKTTDKVAELFWSLGQAPHNVGVALDPTKMVMKETNIKLYANPLFLIFWDFPDIFGGKRMDVLIVTSKSTKNKLEAASQRWNAPKDVIHEEALLQGDGTRLQESYIHDGINSEVKPSLASIGGFIVFGAVFELTDTFFTMDVNKPEGYTLKCTGPWSSLLIN